MRRREFELYVFFMEELFEMVRDFVVQSLESWSEASCLEAFYSCFVSDCQLEFCARGDRNGHDVIGIIII